MEKCSMTSQEATVVSLHKERHSGLELLRLVSMFFILALHINFYGLGEPSALDFNEPPLGNIYYGYFWKASRLSVSTASYSFLDGSVFVQRQNVWLSCCFNAFSSAVFYMGLDCCSAFLSAADRH